MAVGEHAQQSHRLFNCAACGQAVHICRACDRGNVYCAGGCAPIRRTESVRRAGARYQRTRSGATRHAARQSAWRARQLQEVTHQGSPVQGLAATVCAAPDQDSETDNASESEPEFGVHARLAIGAIASRAYDSHGRECRARVGALACGFCRRLLTPWIRTGPLRHAR
jgi:hypothetical protein